MYLDELSARKLATAVILLAVREARGKNASRRMEAVQWLQSKDCEWYFEQLGMDFDRLQGWITRIQKNA